MTIVSDGIQRKISRLRGGSAPRVVDLFSGCGGLSLGFKKAGFAIVAGVESDPMAAASHALNFHGADAPINLDDRAAYVSDIRVLEPEVLAAELGFCDCPESAVDVLIGGPPCQSYARVGRAKLRETADHPDAFKIDPRGNLYLRYLQYVNVLNPLVILIENVPDILNFGGQNIAEEIAEALGAYDCAYTLLNSVFYGVPQMRERMFLIAYRRELKARIRFPAPVNWTDLPTGYNESRRCALKNLSSSSGSQTHYFAAPTPTRDLPKAVTAHEALGDLPKITSHLSQGIGRGPRNLNNPITYRRCRPSEYARSMRDWSGHGSRSQGTTTAHVIRFLPRDYKIFKRMNPGDEYPDAHALAIELFEKYVANTMNTRWATEPGSVAWEEMRKKFVPPYDTSKFPNKWRKLEPDRPARTITAHIGKDSYSHIHYDDMQARTISVREAARLQSFPDGFKFAGAMNAAFRQIGNAVPPLLAWHIAHQIMSDVFLPLRRSSPLHKQKQQLFQQSIEIG